MEGLRQERKAGTMGTHAPLIKEVYNVKSIINEYSRSLTLGFRYFHCPDTLLSDSEKEKEDLSNWYIFCLNPKSGLIVPYNFIFQAEEYEKYGDIVNGVDFILSSGLLITASFYIDWIKPHMAVFLFLYIVLMFTIVFLSWWLYCLPIRQKLRGRPHVSFPPSLTEALVQVQTRVERRKIVTSTFGRVFGVCAGVGAEAMAGKLVGKMVETAMEKSIDALGEWEIRRVSRIE
jgi:hypothetical protein